MYAIENNVPIPTTRKDSRSYPFAELQVGQSFLVSQDDGETKTQVRERSSAAANYAKRKLGHEYCSRAVEGGVRIWRIA